MMGFQIPAFGLWNYCHDHSITQSFDSARLMKRWNRGGGDGEKKGEQLASLRSYSLQRKPPQIKVRTHSGRWCCFRWNSH
jgi:hypothetical protein